MAPVPKGPEKRKTRSWNPTPAISIDDMSAEKQGIANQPRPKRVERFKRDLPEFVLDYNRNRDSQLKYRGKGKPFTDAAEIERRKPRSNWRPPPLSLGSTEKQTSAQPRKKVPPEEPLGPPSGFGGPDDPPPNIDYKIELAKGKENYEWARALAYTTLDQQDIEAAEVMPILNRFSTPSIRKMFQTDYLDNPEYDGKRLGTTGHVQWYLQHMKQKINNLPYIPFKPISAELLEGIRAHRGTRARIERFIQDACIAQKRVREMYSRTTKSATKKAFTGSVSGLKGAPVPSSVSYPTLPSTAKSTSKKIDIGPGPKSVAQPGFKKGTEKKVDSSEFLGRKQQTPPPRYQISDGALKAFVNMYKHYADSSMGFNSIEGLAEYIRQRYETGESVDFQTKKNQQGKTAAPLSNTDLEALLGQYSHQIRPDRVLVNSREGLEKLIRHHYEMDTMLGPRLARRPADIPAAQPLARSRPGASVRGQTRMASGPSIAALPVEVVDHRVDQLMRRYGHLCTGLNPIWTEEDLRAYLRGRIEKDEPITLPPRPSIKQSSKSSIGGTETVQPRTKTAAPVPPGIQELQELFAKDARVTKSSVSSVLSISSVPAGGQSQTTKPINPFSAMVKSPTTAIYGESSTAPRVTQGRSTRSTKTIDQRPSKDST
ncbi:hypothetical protein DSL72_004406 [Monilinia vaccinii-corymbosi]|uniref:Uncharacterized protein n=1 Tax=Monilinia vaccinii-corymbosi TaxID=61207 RepID=A0A8A3P7D3_9HELO|nr:hypothetical protein DSL72_004406 [Monilinia vaccinii-corymbosi]